MLERNLTEEQKYIEEWVNKTKTSIIDMVESLKVSNLDYKNQVRIYMELETAMRPLLRVNNKDVAKGYTI